MRQKQYDPNLIYDPLEVVELTRSTLKEQMQCGLAPADYLTQMQVLQEQSSQLPWLNDVVRVTSEANPDARKYDLHRQAQSYRWGVRLIIDAVTATKSADLIGTIDRKRVQQTFPDFREAEAQAGRYGPHTVSIFSPSFIALDNKAYNELPSLAKDTSGDWAEMCGMNDDERQHFVRGYSLGFAMVKYVAKHRETRQFSQMMANAGFREIRLEEIYRESKQQHDAN